MPSSVIFRVAIITDDVIAFRAETARTRALPVFYYLSLTMRARVACLLEDPAAGANWQALGNDDLIGHALIASVVDEQDAF